MSNGAKEGAVNGYSLGNHMYGFPIRTEISDLE